MSTVRFPTLDGPDVEVLPEWIVRTSEGRKEGDYTFVTLWIVTGHATLRDRGH